MSTELDRVDLIFQELGLTRIEGRILYVLLSGNPFSSKSLERAALLRQPEISKGTEKLLKKCWIWQEQLRLITAGKPQNVYMLLLPAKEIFAELRNEAQIEYGKKEKNISELEELLDKLHDDNLQR